MFLFTRFLPFLNAIIAGLAFEYAFLNPIQYVNRIVLGALLLFVGAILLLRRATNAERLTLFTLAVLLFLGAAFLGFFLSSGWPRHIVVGLITIALFVFFEEAYRYIYEPERYHRHAIDHLGAFLGVAALATTMAGIFGLRIFLTTRIVLLLPVTFVVATVLSAAVLATHPMRMRDIIITSVFFGVVVAEITWAVFFLPSHYWVDSLLVAIPYYVALHLVRHELAGTLQRKHIRRYTIVSMTTLILIVLTAQWVL